MNKTLTLLKENVTSEKYNIMMFAFCVLYTLTALPRLGISDEIKNIILFGSIPFVFFTFNTFNKKIFILLAIAVIIQLSSWISSLYFISDIAKTTPNLKPLTSIFMFAIIAIWINGDKYRRYIIYTSFIVSFIITALYDNQLNNSIYLGLTGQRIDYNMHNAQFTSMLSAIVGMLAIYLFCQSQQLHTVKAKYATQISLIAVLLFAVFSMYASQSRQVWLAVSITILIAPIAIYRGNSLKKIIMSYTMIAVIVCGLSQINTIKSRIFNESEVASTIISGDLENIPMTSIGIRVNSWLEAVNWIKKSPILGSDFNSISHVIRDSEKFIQAKLTGFGHLHNTYIEILVSYGIIGIIFYIYLYKEIITNIVNQKDSSEKKLLCTFLFFWMVINMFESFNHKTLGLYAHTIILSGLYTIRIKSKTV